MGRRLFLPTQDFPCTGHKSNRYDQCCLGDQCPSLHSWVFQEQPFFLCADYSGWWPGSLLLEYRQSKVGTDVTERSGGVMMVFQVDSLVI
jgi:hypothetical protein